MTDRRAKITAGELVVVLSHYDLGAIHSVERFRAGSRLSPKVLVVSDRGRFLLKRPVHGDTGNADAPGPGQVAAASVGATVPDRVEFSHRVTDRLGEAGFPIPERIPARGTGRPFLVVGGRVYELSRFVEGARYDQSAAQAWASGALLARFRSMTEGWKPPCPEPVGTFHNRPEFSERLAAVRERIPDPRARALTRSLADLYARAADHAERAGVSRRPSQVIHADWHPGNIIFRPAPPTLNRDSPGAGILAVVDFDSTRMGPAVIDLANGALQFSVMRRFSPASNGNPLPGIGGSVTPPPKGTTAEPEASHPEAASRQWRIAMDPQLLAVFCAGYRTEMGGLSAEEWAEDCAAIPWLMAEALIVEAVLPIAATGRFGRLDPLPLLALVERTAGSILAEHGRLVGLAAGQ